MRAERENLDESDDESEQENDLEISQNKKASKAKQDKVKIGPIISQNKWVSKSKGEFWWVVVGDKARNLLLEVKKVSLAAEWEKTLELELTEAGEYNLSVFLVCNGYLGCDCEVQNLEVTVLESGGGGIAEEGR